MIKKHSRSFIEVFLDKIIAIFERIKIRGLKASH